MLEISIKIQNYSVCVFKRKSGYYFIIMPISFLGQSIIEN